MLLYHGQSWPLNMRGWGAVGTHWQTTDHGPTQQLGGLVLSLIFPALEEGSIAVVDSLADHRRISVMARA